MIETLSDRPAPVSVTLPVGVADGVAAFRGAMRARSQIVWGEHCSECAYPACYAHCAFYTPRSDFNCRRFEAGFEPLAADPALHRVRFRKWGKLEGHGPAPILPIAAARAADRRDAQVSGLIATIPAPHLVKQNLTWRWNTRKGGAGARHSMVADAFVVEAWASDEVRHPFTLTILNTRRAHGRPVPDQFRHRRRVSPPHRSPVPHHRPGRFVRALPRADRAGGRGGGDRGGVWRLRFRDTRCRGRRPVR